MKPNYWKTRAAKNLTVKLYNEIVEKLGGVKKAKAYFFGDL